MCHEVYQKFLAEHLAKWEKRQSRRIDPEWLNAALLVIRLDLDPLRADLEKLYSTSPRGRTPFDPVTMLRALLLMMALGQDKMSFAAHILATIRITPPTGAGILIAKSTKIGPTVYVKSDSDPRLYPAIARDSSKYNELMKLRSGYERSNSVKKVTHKLERRPCRSDARFLVRLYLISIIEHAKAWVAEDRKALGDDFAKLTDLEQIKALAKT